MHNDRGPEGLCVCAWLCEIGFLLQWEADSLISGAHADFLAGYIVPAVQSMERRKMPRLVSCGPRPSLERMALLPL